MIPDGDKKWCGDKKGLIFFQSINASSFGNSFDYPLNESLTTTAPSSLSSTKTKTKTSASNAGFLL